jgi:hypothetical protein
MFRFKALALFACMLGLIAAAGCGDACLSLANQICSCKADEKFCQGKLDAHACDCNKLNTAEGRLACGLVINPP